MSNPSLSKFRWQSVTKGENAEVLIAGAQAYTAQTTYALFQANAVDGEVGMFDATTFALLTTALAANQKYFVAQKRDTFCKKTNTVPYDVNKTRRVPYTAPVKQVTTITIDVSLYTTTVFGDDPEIALIETTTGNEPYPTWAYDSIIGDSYKGTATLTLAAALTNIVARINDIGDLVHRDDVLNGQTPFTAAISNTGTVYTITITGGFFFQSFRIAIRGPIKNIASVVYTTPFVMGSGFYDHVLELEGEGWIFEGVTTNYPGEGVTPLNFGYPTSYVVNGLTYNIYHLDPVMISPEPNAVNVRHHYPHLYIITPVPVGGTTGARALSSPDLAIGTVLGFTLTP